MTSKFDEKILTSSVNMDKVISEFKSAVRAEKRNQNIPEKVFETVLNEYAASESFIQELMSYREKYVDMSLAVKEIAVNYCIDLPILLFEKAVNKYGIDLWNGKACRSRNCYKKCPLGDFCNHSSDFIYNINGYTYCIGQLYMMKCYPEKCKRVVSYDDYQDDILHAWNFTLDFSRNAVGRSRDNSFVPQYHRFTNKYIGGNVIPYL